MVEYDLEWNTINSGDVSGQGYVVVRPYDHQRINWESLTVKDGLIAFNVAGVSFNESNLQSPRFAPGQSLALVREPDNQYDSNAVAVWDASRQSQVGYVPKELAKSLSSLEEGEPLVCYSMWEHNKGDKRVGLGAIVVLNGVQIHWLPRLATRR